MPTPRLSLHLACLLLAGVSSEPAPGRVPKVYNALITSNQNLEPSKAFPVYQPVIHEAPFAYPYSPVFYGDYPINNGLFPFPPSVPKTLKPVQPAQSPDAPPPATSETPPEDNTAAPETPPPPPEPKPEADSNKPTAAPPLPPNTQSPIPLNEFGLPPQVLPLGRIDPAYNGFTQVGPFTYPYPSFRFYDPYDPFSYNPYANFPPLYRPLANALTQNPVPPPSRDINALPAPPAPPAPKSNDEAPPSEPNDLNVLNYSSKDPAIPNVPPPPLPQGGLKPDESE